MNQWTSLEQHISTRSEKSIEACDKIFHGPSGIIPGLEQLLIDRFGKLLYVVTYNLFSSEDQGKLISILIKHFPTCFIRIQYRASGSSEELYLSEDCPEELTVRENGLDYLVHSKRGQNPGFFADMINGRKRIFEYIQDLAVPKNDNSSLTVLNLFSYTCSFSVTALKAGAFRVDNWDMNRNSLNVGKKNHEINNIDSRKSAYFAYDIFKSFSKIKKRGPYSLVIMDPPPMQGKSFQYRKDYPRLMKRVEQILAEGGAVLFCLNAPDCGKDEFLDMINRETPGHFDFIDDTPCPPEYMGRFRDRGLKTFFAGGYHLPHRES